MNLSLDDNRQKSRSRSRSNMSRSNSFEYDGRDACRQPAQLSANPVILSNLSACKSLNSRTFNEQSKIASISHDDELVKDDSQTISEGENASSRGKSLNFPTNGLEQ
jgi:hypothetical protein